jgi:hypothetical protein
MSNCPRLLGDSFDDSKLRQQRSNLAHGAGRQAKPWVHDAQVVVKLRKQRSRDYPLAFSSIRENLMAHSFTGIYLHIIFSTKNRRRVL